MSEVMNAQQLAKYLGISYSNLKAFLSRDESKLPPYITVGDHKRWYLSTVRAWIEKQTEPNSLSGTMHETSEL